MRPSTTDACTVLRRRGAADDLDLQARRGSVGRREVELQLVERIRHAAPRIWSGVVTATSWGSTRITRSPSVETVVGHLHPPSAEVREAGPPTAEVAFDRVHETAVGDGEGLAVADDRGEASEGGEGPVPQVLVALPPGRPLELVRGRGRRGAPGRRAATRGTARGSRPG